MFFEEDRIEIKRYTIYTTFLERSGRDDRSSPFNVQESLGNVMAKAAMSS
jgi:hypothetical protein